MKAIGKAYKKKKKRKAEMRCPFCGTMADRTLRELRNAAHHCFDQLYKKEYMTKAEAYMWLSQKLALPLSETHIGLFGTYYCETVIRECRKFMEGRRLAGRKAV